MQKEYFTNHTKINIILSLTHIFIQNKELDISHILEASLSVSSSLSHVAHYGYNLSEISTFIEQMQIIGTRLLQIFTQIPEFRLHLALSNYLRRLVFKNLTKMVISPFCIFFLILRPPFLLPGDQFCFFSRIIFLTGYILLKYFVLLNPYC